MAKNDSSRERYMWVDYARGVAILLIVYRHTLVGLKRTGLAIPDVVYNFQEYAYNFRMPVFFMLSGVFLFFSLQKKAVEDIFRNRVSTILYPYLLWAVILISFQILFAGVTNASRTTHDYLYIITQPRELDHMWYLLALFNTSILCLILYKFLFSKPLIHLVIALLFHFSSYFLRDYSLFSDPLYHYIFLVIGLYAAKYLPVFKNEKLMTFAWRSFFILPFFLLGQYYWIVNKPGGLVEMIPFLLIILVACLFFYFVCRFLSGAGVLPQLTFVGRYSLYIYILHIYIISSFRVFSLRILGIENLAFLITGSILLGIGLPILFFIAIERMNLWYLFAFDNPKKRR